MDLLEQEGSVKVEMLADLFSVSQVTIRKDLTELEELGLVQRTYGGAAFSHRSRFNISFLERLQLRRPAKDAIAQAALQFIHEGDSLILDAGSTTLSLAQALIGKYRSLFIITTSVPVALELAQAGYEILLVGGQVRNHSLALIGPVAIRTLESHHADRAFIGSSGVTLTHGHSTPNPLDAESKRAIIRSADESYVLVDSSKFGHACLATFAMAEDIDLTITDSAINPSILEDFRRNRFAIETVETNPAHQPSQTAETK
jgi:DeoR family transcriptional regulator of aga operon/DeoR family fructose operon transcriptional repressor